MRTKTENTIPAAFIIDGTIYDRQVRGGLMLLVDDAGQAYTLDHEGRSLPTLGDLFELVRIGRAEPVHATGRRPDRHLRGLRPPMPAATVPWTMDEPHGTDGPARGSDLLRSADDALTLGAFVHLSDPDTDALDGYDIYLRALIPLRDRHGGADPAVATPTAFRRRVEEVRAALAATDEWGGPVAPTIH